MKPISVLMTLGVSTSLLLGNNAALGIIDLTNTTTTSSATVLKKVETTPKEVETAQETTVEETPVEEAPKEIVVTIKEGDSLEKIAQEYDTTYVELFNANPSITHPDLINVGDSVIIPVEGKEYEDRFSQVAQPTVVNTPAVSGGSAYQSGSTVSATSYNTGNGMWCTDYVHSKRPDVRIYGNAGYNWISAAQAEGRATGSTPSPGAIAVMNGHVAYVESVNADGTYVVSEMGWNYQAGSYNIRTVQPGAFGGFIY